MMYQGMPMGGPGGLQRGGPGRGGRMPPVARAGYAPRGGAPMHARPIPPPPQTAPTPHPTGLTTAMLAAAPPEQQKQMLGERLYPLVHSQQPALAGKITGMLLEMDNSELLILLEDAQELSARVNEAITVLQSAAEAPRTPQ